MNYCNQCGSASLKTTERIFKNQSKHIQIDCRDCGAFNGFKKQAGKQDVLIAKDHRLHSTADVTELLKKTKLQLDHFFKDNTAESVTLIAKVK